MYESSSGGDVMSASTVVSKPIGALSAVHGPEITQERLELTNGGDRVTRLHPPAIIGLRSDTHECVEGSLTAHFLKGIPDVSVDENSRIVGVLGLRGRSCSMLSSCAQVYTSWPHPQGHPHRW